jgi:hypothetical protein
MSSHVVHIKFFELRFSLQRLQLSQLF